VSGTFVGSSTFDRFTMTSAGEGDIFVAKLGQQPAQPPAILSQPTSQLVIAGSNVVFAVGASGTPPLTYQWTRNGTKLSVATNSLLSIGGVQQSHAGDYAVIVTNAYGAVTSSVATLTVVFPPSLTMQPGSRVSECASTNLFSVTASGDAPLFFQWFFNRVTAIAHETNSILAVLAVPATAGDYLAVVSNRFGSVTSAVATLTVADTTPPVVVLNGAAALILECHTVFVDPGAIATDSCAGLRLVSVSGAVDTSTVDSYIVRYMASDLSGNSATNARLVTVVDTTPPLVTLNGAARLTVECHTGFIDPGATATDACAGPLPVITRGAVNANVPDTYTLRYVATDPSGNSATNVRVVTVADTAPPILNGQGTNMTIDCPSTPVFTAPRVTDSCDAVPTITFSDAATPGASAGTYIATRTWLAIDQSGNTSAPVRQTITVRDTKVPDVTCPTNIAVEFGSQAGAMVRFVASATDGCDGGVIARCTPGPGSIFSIGTTSVLCTAIDASSNAASCSFTIAVLGARGVKQNVLTELASLRPTVTDANERRKLEEAITHLMKSLNAELWIDQIHLERNDGEKAFQEEKDTVHKLSELIKNKRSTIPDAVIQGLIERVVRADRLISSVAIQDAIDSSAAQKKIAEAEKKLAEGDSEATDGNCDKAIERYQQAWQRAVPARILAVRRSPGRPMQLEVVAEPGRSYLIQASTNLTTWGSIATRTADRDGILTFEDVNASGFGVRYYRIQEP
jgi:hypothetical protein